VGFLPAEVEDPGGLGELRACRVFAGYAGWGPGQLEQELAEAAWIVADPESDDVFSTDPDGLWRAVLRRRGGADAVLALLPADPRVN
jgi:putative transcriptional regulator